MDDAGNTSTEQVFITLDTTRPRSFNVDSPAGWVLRADELSWDSSSDLHGVTYAVFVDDGFGAVEHAVASGANLDLDLAPGDYVWWVTATDSFGNVTSTTHTGLHVVGTLELAKPDAGALFSGDLALAWSDALHAPGGVEHLEVEFTHKDGETFVTEVDAGEFELLQTFAAGRPDGEWTVRVRAVYTDLVPEFGSRNGEWSPSVVVTRDATAPATPILKSPGNGVTQASYDLEYRWSTVTGIDHYEFRASPTSTVSMFGELVDGGSYDVDDALFEATAGADGVGWWQVRAVDAPGNASAWTTPWKLILDHSYVAPKPAKPGKLGTTDSTEETATEPTPGARRDRRGRADRRGRRAATATHPVPALPKPS